jgi:hypothetical protein
MANCIKEEAVNLVNLTPHAVNLLREDGGLIVSVPPNGQVARVQTLATETGSVEINGYSIPIVSTEYGEVENLPEPQEDTIFIVSVLVVSALKGQRNDVVAPDTGPESVVRDAQGQIRGVHRLTR